LQKTAGDRCFFNGDGPIADSSGQAGKGRRNVRWSSNFGESFKAQWALFAACEKPIKDWFAAGYKAQTKAALAGKVPPGMKLVQTQTKRAWLNDEWARDFVVTRFGVDALEAPSPAQVEKLGATKKEIEGLVTRPEGGPALAFQSDKRPTWARKTGAEMFGSLVGEKGA
jgi:hypothetical protein